MPFWQNYGSVPAKTFFLRASNKMNCSIESERFFVRQGGCGKIAGGVAKYYVEDGFGAANAAGQKISRLNAKAFC